MTQPNKPAGLFSVGTQIVNNCRGYARSYCYLEAMTRDENEGGVL